MKNKLTLSTSKKSLNLVDKTAFEDAQLLARSAKRNSKGVLAGMQWVQAMMCLKAAYGL